MKITNSFGKLEAWREAHKLVIMIYKTTEAFPKKESYRLIDQLCRSVSSVAAILVEGNARGSRKEYIHFIYQSRGSLEETKYHLMLARDLGYLNDRLYNEIIEQANKVGELINGLLRYLRSNKNV